MRVIAPTNYPDLLEIDWSRSHIYDNQTHCEIQIRAPEQGHSPKRTRFDFLTVAFRDGQGVGKYRIRAHQEKLLAAQRRKL